MNLLGLLEIPNWIIWTLGFLLLAYVYLTWNFDYWKKQGIPGSKPYPLIGTFYVLFKEKFITLEEKLMKKYGKVYGGFTGRKPVLGCGDPDFLRQVLIKDFHNFRDRLNFENPGVMKKSLFHINGEGWYELRRLLTPVFTTGKLKQMVPLISTASNRFVENMAEKCDKSEPFEIKEYTGGFTMDVISSVAFGLDIDSQKNKDDPFIYHAKKVMDVSITDIFTLMLIFFPSLLNFLERKGIYSFVSPAEAFFSKVVKDTLKQRRQGIGVRPDMLQLMLEAERHLKEADEEAKEQLKQDGLEGYTNRRKKAELSEDDMIAQSVLFFLAGYDTTATTLSFLYYNLARNQDAQDKVVEEIKAAIGEKPEPTAEDLTKMSYLEMCINETLRLYPPVIRTDRRAQTDCEVEGIKLQKGMPIGIPIRALHYDPEVWPEPEKFDPLRFTPEAKASRDSMCFMPFGMGPRMCIGNRLAIMEMKHLTAQFLRKYRVVTCSQTQIPIQFENKVVLKPEKGIWLKLEHREES